MAGRDRWIEIHNCSPKGHVSRAGFDQNTTVTSNTAECVEVSEFLGWHWPLDIFDSVFGEEKRQGSSITTVKHKGKLVKGILRAGNTKPCGLAVQGVLSVTERSSAQVIKSMGLGSEDTELRTGQLDAAHRRALQDCIMILDDSIDDSRLEMKQTKC